MRENQTRYEIKLEGHTFRGIADIDEPFEGDDETPSYPAQAFTNEIYLNGGLVDVSDILDPKILHELCFKVLEEVGYA